MRIKFVSKGKKYVATICNKKKSKKLYAKVKNYDDDYYMSQIIDYLERYKQAKKSDFIKLLSKKLPKEMTDVQKDAKVKNLLQKLRKNGVIKQSSENKRASFWVLV